MTDGHQLCIDPAAGEPVLLAVDIGGTWMRLGAVDAEGRWSRLERVAHSDHHPGEGIARFLAEVPSIRAACVAVAGPVIGGRVQMTNRPWALDAVDLRSQLCLDQTWLINDLQALACALPALGTTALVPLRGRVDPERGNIAIVAPGTGLGEAFLVADGGHLTPVASEGGHSEFAPRGALQRALLAYWAERVGHVEAEFLGAGAGLGRIHEFLLAERGVVPCAGVATAIATAEDAVPAIVTAALAIDDERSSQQPCPECDSAVEIWLDILAGEAANLALKVLAVGGVCLAGNILARLEPRLNARAFADQFDGAGHLRGFLHDVPLAQIDCIDAPLLGAAQFGLARRAR